MRRSWKGLSYDEQSFQSIESLLEVLMISELWWVEFREHRGEYDGILARDEI